MVTSEKRWRRLVFRWTALKGFTAIVLFFVLALFIEYFVVTFFLSSGLTDQFLLTQIFQIPGTSLSFTVTIGPLYHLIPLGVIFVLVSSWTYLTKYIAVVPHRLKPQKKPTPPRKKYQKLKRKRFKSFRHFSKWLSKKFQRVSWTFKAFYRRMSSALLKIRGISYVMQRLFFARAALKSAVTVLAVFLVSALGLYLLAYPTLLYNVVVGFHIGNPSFHGFVLKTIEMTNGLGQVLSPIGLGSSINNALTTAALGFYTTFEGFGASVTQPLIRLDLVWKYTLCQNFAAWTSALIAWAYGQYSSRLYRRRPR
jgi:hypothetical protein